jgi:flagellar hook protein FlgE
LVLQRGEETVYTRTGSFEVNSDGFVVLSGTEYRLATLDANGKAQAVSIDALRTSKPSATTKITMADNLSSSATTFSVSDVKVYDPSGGQHTWQFTFDKDQSAAAGTWNVTIKDEAGTTVATKPITFTNGVIDSQSAQVSIADAAHGFTVNLDLTGVTSFSSGTVSTLRAASSDGFTTGTLTSVTVNTDGQLELGYSNSQKSQVGSVAIAEFRNPEALKQRSGGLFTSSGDSQHTIVQSGDPRVGKIQSRRLEASNVDLTTEFSDLILVQRGFQASSQIISVSNEMIQQLFGIRGQG